MKIKKVILAIALTLAILMSSFAGVYADTINFSDLNSSHWAYSQVMDATSMGIINGYTENGKKLFKPENKVSKQEALTMIYKMLEYMGCLKSADDYSSELGDELKAAKIADWASVFGSYAFRYGICSASDFTAKGGAAAEASRQLLCKWVVNALELSETSAAVLKYNDNDKVGSGYAPFVDAMFRFGLMTGSDTGNINAADGIKRSEFCSVCVRLAKLRLTVSEANSVGNYYGSVSKIDAKNRSFVLSDANGKASTGQQTYKFVLGPDTKLIIDGKEGTFSDLADLGSRKLAIGTTIGPANTLVVMSQPHVVSGKIAYVMAYADFTLITVDVNGLFIDYVIDAGTACNTICSVGANVSFWADGIVVQEIE